MSNEGYDYQFLPIVCLGNVGISVTDEMGRDVAMDTQDMRDGTFRVSYTANTPGPTYTVRVFFNNQEVPRSPFKVPVKPNVDMSKIRVDNLSSSKSNVTYRFTFPPIVSSSPASQLILHLLNIPHQSHATEHKH